MEQVNYYRTKDSVAFLPLKLNEKHLGSRMNDRLGELAVQAGLKKPHGSDTEFLVDFDWRYFAKLVIKECSELTLDYKNDDHYNGWLEYRDEIRKHFGLD